MNGERKKESYYEATEGNSSHRGINVERREKELLCGRVPRVGLSEFSVEGKTS